MKKFMESVISNYIQCFNENNLQINSNELKYFLSNVVMRKGIKLI